MESDRFQTSFEYLATAIPEAKYLELFNNIQQPGTNSSSSSTSLHSVYVLLTKKKSNSVE